MNKKGNYAFIDSQNLNLGIQKNGWKMDWRKFRIFLAEKYGVKNAYLFIGHMPEHEDMYMQMHDLGFLVVLKPTLETNKSLKDLQEIKEKAEAKTDEPARTTKGNIDADLVLWVMKELKNYDKAIIVSGDGDFFSLVEFLQERHKLLHIMTPNWQYSSLLKPFERYIVRLDKLRRELAYKDYKKLRKNGKPSAGKLKKRAENAK